MEGNIRVKKHTEEHRGQMSRERPLMDIIPHRDSSKAKHTEDQRVGRTEGDNLAQPTDRPSSHFRRREAQKKVWEV